MTTDFEVGVRLTADGKDLAGVLRAAQGQIGGVSQVAQKANEQTARSAAQFTQSLKRQAETIGLTASQALRYDAAQLKLNATQRASVDASIRTIEAYERQQIAARKNVDVLGSLKSQLIAASAAYLSFRAAADGGKAIVQSALAQERLNNSLKVGLGSQQAATKEIQFLREESDRLGLQFVSTAEQYAKLSAASKGTELQGQATRDVFLAIAKSATVLGLSADQTGGALTAIEQIISKGKVSAEELRGQLGERLPGAFQIAARAIGVTTAELDEMLSRGELTAQQLLPALARELENTYGAQAQEAAQGLNAKINRLDNSFTDLKLSVGQTGIIDLFTDGIQLATQFVGKITDVVNVVSSIPGVKTVASAAFGGGVLPLIFGKDAQAATTDIKQTTAALEQAEQVINRIITPGAKPQVPAEFSAALKREAAERKKIADQIVRDAQRAAKQREREAQQAVDASNRIIDSLRRETQEIGLNNVQKRLLTAATEAAKAPTQELAAEIMASAQAWAMATQAQEDAVANNRQMQEAATARQRAETQAAQAVQQEWNQMWSTVENTARTSFTQFAAHGVSAMESIGRSIQNGIIDLLYQLTFRPFIINIGTRLLGGIGSGGATGTGGALNAASTGLSAASLLGAGSGAFSGSGLLGAFGAGLSGGSSAAAFIGAESTVAGAGLAASLGAAAAPVAALLAVDQIGKFLANGRTTGTFVDKVPVIGGLAGALFGRKPFKADRQDLVGTITSAGFEGVFNDSYKAKGSVFRGSRRDNIIVDTDTGALLNQYGRLSESGVSGQLSQFIDPAIERAQALGSVLDDSITTTVESLRSVVDTLGISAASLDNFSLSVDLMSEKGQQLSDADIAGVIAGATEQMATGLIPEIGNLANRGESAVQTMVRLGAQFDVLTNAASVVLGKFGEDAKAFVQSFGLADQTAFVDAVGGLDVLSQGVNQFFNSLDDSDKLPILEGRLRTILQTVGVDFIPSMDQYIAAVKSGSLSNEQYVAAFNPVTQALIKQVDDLRTSLGTELPESLNVGTQKVDDLAKKEAELARAREASIRVAEKSARREAQQNVIDLAQERKNRSIDSEIGGAEATAQRERDLLKLRFDNERALLEESRERSQAITGFVSDLRRSSLSTGALSFADAGNILSGAIGRVANGEDFQNIISERVQAAVGATGNINEGRFASYADFARARGEAASRINELAALGENQLTTEGQTLAELEKQTAVLQQTYDVLSRRIDSGLEFDKALALANTFGGITTAQGTAKQAKLNTQSRKLYVLENDLIPDPVQINNARIDRLMTLLTPESVFGGAEISKELLKTMKIIADSMRATVQTNKILKRVTAEGDALNVRSNS